MLFTAVEYEIEPNEHDDEDNEEESGHKGEDDDADSMIGSTSIRRKQRHSVAIVHYCSQDLIQPFLRRTPTLKVQFLLKCKIKYLVPIIIGLECFVKYLFWFVLFPELISIAYLGFMTLRFKFVFLTRYHLFKKDIGRGMWISLGL